MLLTKIAIGLFAIAYAGYLLLRLKANARNGNFLAKQDTVDKGHRDV